MNRIAEPAAIRVRNLWSEELRNRGSRSSGSLKKNEKSDRRRLKCEAFGQLRMKAILANATPKEKIICRVLGFDELRADRDPSSRPWTQDRVHICNQEDDN